MAGTPIPKTTSWVLTLIGVVIIIIVIGIAISKVFANTHSQVMAFILLFGMILFFS